MYCVNENKDAKAHFAFFFNFSFCHSSYIYIWTFSTTTSFRIMKFCVHVQVRKVYCVNENYGANPHFAVFKF